MTIKELKDKLSKYDQDTQVKIKINVLSSNFEFIENTIEEIEIISFTDYLNDDENIVSLETTYVSKVEE